MKQQMLVALAEISHYADRRCVAVALHFYVQRCQCTAVPLAHAFVMSLN